LLGDVVAVFMAVAAAGFEILSGRNVIVITL
jgi:hypothetical protein